MAWLYCSLPPSRQRSMPRSIRTLIDFSCCTLSIACSRSAIASFTVALLLTDAAISIEKTLLPQSNNLTEEREEEAALVAPPAMGDALTAGLARVIDALGRVAAFCKEADSSKTGLPRPVKEILAGFFRSTGVEVAG